MRAIGRRAAVRAGLGLVVWSLVTGAAAALASGQPAAAGEARIVRVLNADIGTLDPHRATSLEDDTLAHDLAAGLIAFRADGSLGPGLAAEWTVAEDGLTYRFRMKPDLRWSDGSPLTADDIVASFRRAVAPKTAAPYASYLYPIVGAEAVNRGKAGPEALAVQAVAPDVIEIRLHQPTPYFPQVLALPIASVVPVADGAAPAAGTAPAKTTGAFVLAGRRPLFGLTVRRNPHFHDAASVRLDGVDYVVIDNASAAIRRFEAREVDIIEDVALGQIPRLRRERPEELRFDRIRGLYYFVLNVRDARLSDRRVREALRLALDRTALVRDILRAGDTAATGLVPTGTRGYGGCAVESEPPLEERQAQARALLREAGYGPDRPLRIEIRYNTHDTHRRVALVAASLWKQVGVEASLLSTDFRVHFNDLGMGKYQVGRAGWTANVDDPFMFFDLVRGGADSNDSGYANPAVDALIAEAGRTIDPDERAALFCRAERIALADVPVIPLFYPAKRSLVAPRVLGWQDNGRSTRASRFLDVTRPES